MSDVRIVIDPEAQAEASEGVPGAQQQPPGREPPRREPPRRDPPRGKKPGSSRSIVIGIAGGLITAGAIAAVLWPGANGARPAGVGEESALEVLVPGDINAALPTLDPGFSKAAVDDAKNCKVPLAWVTLTQRPGDHGDMVRVRSGTYISPPIKLTPAPQRVAIPYPAPYPAGRGVLTLIGEANQVGLYLTPGGVHDVDGAYSVNVTWQVRSPCP